MDHIDSHSGRVHATLWVCFRLCECITKRLHHSLHTEHIVHVSLGGVFARKHQYDRLYQDTVVGTRKKAIVSGCIVQVMDSRFA